MKISTKLAGYASLLTLITLIPSKSFAGLIDGYLADLAYKRVQEKALERQNQSRGKKSGPVYEVTQATPTLFSLNAGLYGTDARTTYGGYLCGIKIQPDAYGSSYTVFSQILATLGFQGYSSSNTIISFNSYNPISNVGCGAATSNHGYAYVSKKDYQSDKYLDLIAEKNRDIFEKIATALATSNVYQETNQLNNADLYVNVSNLNYAGIVGNSSILVVTGNDSFTSIAYDASSIVTEVNYVRTNFPNK